MKKYIQVVGVAIVAMTLFGCAETTQLRGAAGDQWQRCYDEKWYLPEHPILRGQACEQHVREARGLPPAARPRSIMDAPNPLVNAPSSSQRTQSAATANQLAAAAQLAESQRRQQERQHEQSSTAPSASSASNSASGRRTVGDKTGCVHYQALHRQETAQWFSFSNKCSESVKVYHTGTSGSTLSSLLVLSPGQSDKSWFLTTKTTSVRHLACPSQSGGKEVRFDTATQTCYTN